MFYPYKTSLQQSVPATKYLQAIERIRLLGMVVIFTFVLVGCGNDEPYRLKIGDRAPEFKITDLDGVLISSEEWRGFPVILRFWDTECKYCRADTPIFNRYFDDYRQRGLKVLYVATGNETLERIDAFVKDLEIIFPVAFDSDGTLADAYQVKMVPQTIFISPDQKIITAILGGVGAAELEELIGGFLVN
jgi:peroxiredoxin